MKTRQRRKKANCPCTSGIHGIQEKTTENEMEATTVYCVGKAIQSFSRVRYSTPPSENQAEKKI